MNELEKAYYLFPDEIREQEAWVNPDEDFFAFLEQEELLVSIDDLNI